MSSSSNNNNSGMATTDPMPTSQLLNDPEEVARLLQGISQAAHDTAEAAHAAHVLLGINNKPEPGTYSRGSTRSPSPQHFSEAAPPNSQGTKRRRRREPSELSDHSANTPTRGIDTAPATTTDGLNVFNPWDPQTHETLVEHIKRGRYITGLPLEVVDPEAPSKGKHQKHVEISIATLRERGHEIETKTVSWLRADPLVEKGRGPEGKQTWEMAVKAEQHFRELVPDEVIKERKAEEEAAKEGKRWKGKGKEVVKPEEEEEEEEGDEVVEEEDEDEEEEEDEEVGAPGPSQAKRRRLDIWPAQPATLTRRAASTTAPKGKGKGKAAAADNRSRSPETPYMTPPFSPNNPPQPQPQPGTSGFTPVNRRPLLPQEPVGDLAARLVDLAGAPKRGTAKRVTFGAGAGSIEGVLAMGSKEGDGEKMEVKAMTTTTKGRVVQKPKKFGE
ncbi:MAG: hypothetical protein Q9208_006093 [Pyrenodesmia sp. 3 TL-2023]